MVWFQSNGTEGLFVLRYVLAQDIPERFCLLRAEIDALRVLDGYRIGRILVYESEGKEKIPHTYAHLHAV